MLLREEGHNHKLRPLMVYNYPNDIRLSWTGLIDSRIQPSALSRQSKLHASGGPVLASEAYRVGGGLWKHSPPCYAGPSLKAMITALDFRAL